MRKSLVIFAVCAGAAACVAPAAAPGAEGLALESDEGCEESSTPNLQANALEVESDGFFLLVAANTNRFGDPRGAVVFRDGEHRLRRIQIHRMFLRGEDHSGGGHTDGGTHDPGDSHTDGGTHDPGDGHTDGGAEHPEQVWVALRGKGWLSDGTTVRAQVDLRQAAFGGVEDVARVRWRPFHEGEEGHPGVAADGDCAAEWMYRSHWFPVERLTVRTR